MAARFSGVGWRVGRVSSWVAHGSDAISARKAFRQLMVRGMPLKLMHLSPTSRISSAAESGVSEAGDCVVATWWRMASEAGELCVNVAAACYRRHMCW